MTWSVVVREVGVGKLKWVRRLRSRVEVPALYNVTCTDLEKKKSSFKPGFSQEVLYIDTVTYDKNTNTKI